MHVDPFLLVLATPGKTVESACSEAGLVYMRGSGAQAGFERAERIRAPVTKVETAVAYHNRTKHHFGRFAAALGYLDWETIA